LAEQLLDDIELSKISPTDIVRKASRLARLADDTEAMLWLSYEVSGYPDGKSIGSEPWSAAIRSNRVHLNQDGKNVATISGIGQLVAMIDSAKTQLVSKSSQLYLQNSIRKEIIETQGFLDKVIGSIHTYVSNKYQELRFGAAVETIFESIRDQVDSNLAQIAPTALPILSTALENLAGDNPIQWNNAAKGCRDLIKAVADSLHPPGKPVNGIKMTDSAYINRLVDWIKNNLGSKTTSEVIICDLEDLGKRLDAFTKSGNKGTHSNVTKQQASRYVVGTYLLLGDILYLRHEKFINNDEKTENNRFMVGTLITKDAPLIIQAQSEITKSKK